MKIGVAVDSMGPSQLSYSLIKSANSLESQVDLIAFYENLTRPILKPRFACMQLAEAWSYDGVLIATNLSTAEKVISFPGPAAKYFYCWDLEWLRPRRKVFRDFQTVYGSPKLTLLTRSEDHAAALRVWNREAVIIPDFDLMTLITFLEK